MPSKSGSSRKKMSLVRMAKRAEFPLRSAPAPKGQTPLAPNVGANYDTEWARRFPARVTRRMFRDTVGKAVVRYYAKPTIKGLDRLQDLNGAALFASNHQSHADTAVMITSIPEPWCNRLIVGAAADYFFSNQITSTLSALLVGAIPIERASINRRTIDLAVDLLRSGWSMVIYPEGGRSADGWGNEFRPGAAYLARQAGVPVVPVHIRGTFDIMRKGRVWPHRARSVINFGRPLSFASEDNNRRFTRKMQQAVESLADETTSGNWFAARKRSHSNATPSTAGPDAATWRRRWALTDLTNKSIGGKNAGGKNAGGNSAGGDSAGGSAGGNTGDSAGGSNTGDSRKQWPYV